jgi:hypothetical protein
MKILFLLSDAPYGSDKSYNALRTAINRDTILLEMCENIFPDKTKKMLRSVGMLDRSLSLVVYSYFKSTECLRKEILLLLILILFCLKVRCSNKREFFYSILAIDLISASARVESGFSSQIVPNSCALGYYGACSYI